MKLNWNFQRDGGIQTKKTFYGVGTDIFSNNTSGKNLILHAKKKQKQIMYDLVSKYMIKYNN